MSHNKSLIYECMPYYQCINRLNIINSITFNLIIWCNLSQIVLYMLIAYEILYHLDFILFFSAQKILIISLNLLILRLNQSILLHNCSVMISVVQVIIIIFSVPTHEYKTNLPYTTSSWFLSSKNIYHQLIQVAMLQVQIILISSNNSVYLSDTSNQWFCSWTTDPTL